MLTRTESVIEYYRDEAVRTCMRQFVEGRPGQNGSAVFISTCGNGYLSAPRPEPPDRLPQFLERGSEVARSLWDRHDLIGHIDMEYVNPDFPAEPYLDTQRTFALQEPMLHAARYLLEYHGIDALHLLSGRGHHLVWRIRPGSRAYASLAAIGRLLPHLPSFYRSHTGPAGETVGPELARAFMGLGMVMEYMGHVVQEHCAADSPIPPTLTAVTVGKGVRGREEVSFDLSEYGDPLSTRMVRAPFSAYLKPWHKAGVVHGAIEADIPPLFFIPLPQGTTDLRSWIDIMHDSGACRELARRTETYIPDGTTGMESLVDGYRASKVAEFHEYFYSEQHHPSQEWPQTYDRFDPHVLPPCVSRILTQPNDLLLRPAGIQLLVRSLLALNWHPRHIAGLIRSKYERNHGWGPYWFTYDAASRADFYTRLFAGLVLTGRDRLVDFNCVSTREKGYCISPPGPCSVNALRETLLRRIPS
ncbi:MAG: hypothetical protein GF331_23450 [Chitinivibrionales bacterium]|nr:hypothetical protein [Chitinivibrionales bacterium]